MGIGLGEDTRASEHTAPRATVVPVWRAYLPVAVIAVLLAAVPLFIGDSRYFMALAVVMLVFAAYAVAFNIIFGNTGQLFLCLGALAGLSGYTSAILTTRELLPMVATIPLGTLLAAALGAIFSWVAVRRHLEVIFVGIVTLGFSLVFRNVLLGTRDLTGGETGMVVTGGMGTALRDKVPAYYLFLALLVAFLVSYRLIERSHIGWAFRALKDDELAAELAGVDVARYRILAGTIGAGMLGLVGALFAHHDGFVSPTVYGFGEVDIRVILIAAFGGLGSLAGPVIGAGTLAVVDELLRPLGQLRLSVFGAVMIALFLFFRQGVAPFVVDLVAWSRRRLPGRSRAPG